MNLRIRNSPSQCLHQRLSTPQAKPLPVRRCFSSTPAPQRFRIPVRRKQMFKWLNGPGKVFREPRKGSTNYLGAYDPFGNLIRESRIEETGVTPPETEEDLRPFPLNPFFRSEPVLSEPLREEIYKRVVKQGKSVREVSIAMHVAMERIGAVVRMMTIEKERISQGKPVQKRYQATVLGMLPETTYDPEAELNPRHESINDLPVHPATRPQIWHPTSESRHFTREDAGRVFDASLLPSDERIPHPEMIQFTRDRDTGEPLRQTKARLKETVKAMDAEEKAKEEQARMAKEERTTKVEGKRWQFQFEDVDIQSTGNDGRSPSGVGWRYGMPHEDRKRGQWKIPTEVT